MSKPATPYDTPTAIRSTSSGSEAPSHQHQYQQQQQQQHQLERWISVNENPWSSRSIHSCNTADQIEV
ncbi:GL25403 [Drosophila persimilis]|uniref:GL25403 n=1 Tax=Drosophila persimilis TaxID=7234 RepID=B4IS54_DROPE|nr:GL25403 [Drosophila persimilis]